MNEHRTVAQDAAKGLMIIAMKKQVFVFLKGILAGLSIGVGGFLYILMVFCVSGELGKVLGSLLFGVGLFTVCTFSLMLYTGKIGLVFEKKQEKDFYISLPVMYVGNAIGAFSLGTICYFIFRNTDLFLTISQVCELRLSFVSFNDYLSTIVKSFLCGVCVYMAVKCFSLYRLKPVGILLLLFFVFLFVYAGFQHCIANMFYFGFGFIFQFETFINLLLVTIFNSFGPIIGVLLFKLVHK